MYIFGSVQTLNLKKNFLYLLTASVAFSGVVGIFVILFGNFGEEEIKIAGEKYDAT